jgi:ABC-type lipoprotein export system ATPase subunit
MTSLRTNQLVAPNPGARIIQVHDLVKVYSTGAGGFTALKGITLDICEGEFLGIVGKSGAGKTTLLNTITGVSEITSGEVIFHTRENGNGRGGSKPISVRSMDENEMAVWRGHNIGIVYQTFELMPQLDLIDNIMLPQDFSGLYRPTISMERALELLDLVELADHAYKLPAHISGGQKQRVAIARALANDPPVIVADEPTGNLDTVTAENIFQIFKQLVEHGKTIIMVTHDSNLAPRFSRYLEISDGEIVNERINGSGAGHVQGIKANRSSPPDPSAVLPDVQLAPDPKEPVAVPMAEVSLPAKMDSSMPKSGGNKPAILLRDVVKTYVNAAGEFTALKGINLQMNYGQFVSLVGKSGSGKSTLLNMLTGIDHPTSGEVIVGDQNIYRMSESQRALWRGRHVGIVFQFFQLLPILTLLENTMLPMDYCNVYPARERPARAMELLKMVGLEDQAFKLPASVSSGQQQSTAIARALANDPPIIVADEPTGNLDSRSAETIYRLFQDLAAQGKTILIVTHDPSLTRRTDQTVILSDGEIIDEVIARALPFLDHPQMLQATRQAQKRMYPPGSTIIRQGEYIEHFFMVASGEVDVLLNEPKCPEISLARFGPGQFFGEISLLRGGNATASVRAAPDGPVEVALLDRGAFLHLVNGSPSTKTTLDRVAQARLEENLAKAEGCDE